MKKIIVSVHDVSPHYEPECKLIFDALHDIGVDQRSDLIVPNFNKMGALSNYKDFVDYILLQKSMGSELGLHGIHHAYAEFGRMTEKCANDSLIESKKMFEDALGFSPDGFVPPQWQLSSGALKAVESLDFKYTETLKGIRFFGQPFIKEFPLNYDWGASFVDKIMNYLNERKCRSPKRDLIRFAFHPMDVRHGVFTLALSHLKMLLDQGFIPICANQLFSKDSE